QQYQGKVEFRAFPRLYFKGQDEYLDISSSKGHLLSGGASAVPFRYLSADVSYAHSVGGNLGTEFVSVRLDVYRRSLRPFGGFAIGQTAPVLFNVGFSQELVAQNLREGFGGFIFPINVAEFTVAVDWIQVGNTRRSTLT